ncbi:hypothetical protein BDQ12DRAFT_671742 [Crucibulum laeve]|uniref:SNF5-domain-containing protein n=1 Tax=Crucibulum laeve TaxID=68775 RepID=A0A5C3LS51_9AGAR|nr:hypothetical protein BDQ12DRAFT_671742 [Crucibulum laeve]
MPSTPSRQCDCCVDSALSLVGLSNGESHTRRKKTGSYDGRVLSQSIIHCHIYCCTPQIHRRVTRPPAFPGSALLAVCRIAAANFSISTTELEACVYSRLRRLRKDSLYSFHSFTQGAIGALIPFDSLVSTSAQTTYLTINMNSNSYPSYPSGGQGINPAMLASFQNQSANANRGYGGAGGMSGGGGGGMSGVGMGGMGGGMNGAMSGAMGGGGGVNPAQLMNGTSQHHIPQQMMGGVGPGMGAMGGIGNMTNMGGMGGMSMGPGMSGMNSISGMGNMGGMGGMGGNMGGMGGINPSALTSSSSSSSHHPQSQIHPSQQQYPSHLSQSHPSSHQQHPQSHPSQQHPSSSSHQQHPSQHPHPSSQHPSQSHPQPQQQTPHQQQQQQHMNINMAAALQAMGMTREQFSSLSHQEKQVMGQKLVVVAQQLGMQQQQRARGGERGEHPMGGGGGMGNISGMGAPGMGPMGGPGMGGNMGGGQFYDQRPSSSASSHSHTQQQQQHPSAASSSASHPGQSHQSQQPHQSHPGQGGMMPPPPPRPSTAQGMGGGMGGSRPGTAMSHRSPTIPGPGLSAHLQQAQGQVGQQPGQGGQRPPSRMAEFAQQQSMFTGGAQGTPGGGMNGFMGSKPQTPIQGQGMQMQQAQREQMQMQQQQQQHQVQMQQQQQQQQRELQQREQLQQRERENLLQQRERENQAQLQNSSQNPYPSGGQSSPPPISIPGSPYRGAKRKLGGMESPRLGSGGGLPSMGGPGAMGAMGGGPGMPGQGGMGGGAMGPPGLPRSMSGDSIGGGGGVNGFSLQQQQAQAQQQMSMRQSPRPQSGMGMGGMGVGGPGMGGGMGAPGPVPEMSRPAPMPRQASMPAPQVLQQHQPPLMRQTSVPPAVGGGTPQKGSAELGGMGPGGPGMGMKIPIPPPPTDMMGMRTNVPPPAGGMPAAAAAAASPVTNAASSGAPIVPPPPLVTSTSSSSSTGGLPTQAPTAVPAPQQPTQVIPQLPPLPANVNLNPLVTKVTAVPLVDSLKLIPHLEEEEIKDIQGWMKVDKEYEGEYKKMKAKMGEELKEVFGPQGAMWWEKGYQGTNLNRWRRGREPFDVRYPRSRRERDNRGKKPGRREGLRLPRKIQPEDANRPELLVPIRLEFDVEHHKMRDTFVWNLNDPVVTPENFAQSVVDDYALAPSYHSVIVKMIQDQLSDYKSHSGQFDGDGGEYYPAEDTLLKGTLDEENASWWESWRKRVRFESSAASRSASKRGRKKRKTIKEEDADDEDEGDGDFIMSDVDQEKPMTLEELAVDEHTMREDMRILIKLDIIVGSMKLDDQFEWDLENENASPEDFSEVYTQELGLGGEFKTAIAHSIREQVQTYQKSLFLVGHVADGTPVPDEELKQSFLPSLVSGARSVSEVQLFTPLLNYLSDGEIDRTEKERDKDMNKRRKRNTRGRRGIALPDREPIRTYRTPAIGFPELDPATLALAVAANAPMSRRAAAAAASLTIANMVASENGEKFLPQSLPSQAPQPPPTAAKEKKPKGLFKGPYYPPSVLRPRAHVTAPTPSTAADVSKLPVPLDNDPPPSAAVAAPDVKVARAITAKRAKELEREAKEKEFVEGQHPNYIDGVWHCSNCGCPESIAVGRRKGPLGDKSQCGTCGKFWHRHRRPRVVEYNTDPEFHVSVKRVEEMAKTPASKKKGAAAALRAQSTAASATPAADISEPQTPARSNGDIEPPSRQSPAPTSIFNDEDRAISPVSTASSASEAPLAQKVKLNGHAKSSSVPAKPTTPVKPATPVPAPAASAPPPTSKSSEAPASKSAAAAPETPAAPTTPTSAPGKPTWPPSWLQSAMQAMQAKYPHDKFEVILRKVNASTTPEWRIKCLDCPGKLYTPGPAETLSNYEVHLKNRLHRQRVNERVNPPTTPSSSS